MILKILSVFIGGDLGAVLRYLLSVLSARLFFVPLYGTFFANLLGCLLIGYIFGVMLNKIVIIPENVKLLLTAGFLGGLTTFSTLNLETFEFFRCGKVFEGCVYLILSCIFGLLFVYFGFRLSAWN